MVRGGDGWQCGRLQRVSTPSYLSLIIHSLFDYLFISLFILFVLFISKFIYLFCFLLLPRYVSIGMKIVDFPLVYHLIDSLSLGKGILLINSFIFSSFYLFLLCFIILYIFIYFIYFNIFFDIEKDIREVMKPSVSGYFAISVADCHDSLLGDSYHFSGMKGEEEGERERREEGEEEKE